LPGFGGRSAWHGIFDLPGAAAPVAVSTLGQQQLGQKLPVGHHQQSRRRADLSSTAAHALIGEGESHLEVAIIPVSDVDRSKQFYERLGWRLDEDVAPMDGLRVVQFTPPGSACSITFGIGVITAAPGSAEATLIVSDIVSAHKDLVGRGIDVVDVWHGPPFPVQARQPGPDPERTSYGSFCSFNDPDGNTWLVQEVTTRHPGRI
jgi:catechol 2,3-dioxygenase-like lactoylglutathione lyase family enzyme